MGQVGEIIAERAGLEFFESGSAGWCFETKASDLEGGRGWLQINLEPPDEFTEEEIGRIAAWLGRLKVAALQHGQGIKAK